MPKRAVNSMAWEVLTMAPPYVGQVEAYTSYVRVAQVDSS